MSQYIVKLKESELATIYYRNTGDIIFSKIENGRCSNEVLVAKTQNPSFTCSTDGSFLYVIWQGEGTFYISRYINNNFESKPLPKNTLFQDASLPSPLLGKTSLSLIFNTENTDEKQIAIHDIKSNNTKTLTPYTDINANTPYVFQNIYPNYGILFISKLVDKKYTLGMIEVSTEKATSFTPIYECVKDNEKVIDTSFLVTDGGVHALFVVRDNYSTSLYHRKKESTNFSDSTLIATSMQVSNILMTLIKNKLYVFFSTGGQLLYTTSTDFGDTFEPPMRYTNKICAVPLRVNYLQVSPMEASDYFIRQIYVDRNNVFDIQLMQEIYPTFFQKEKIVQKNEDLEDDDELAYMQNKLTEISQKLEITKKLLKQSDDEKLLLLENIKNLELEINTNLKINQ